MQAVSPKRLLGSIELSLLKSENERTKERLVWAARSTLGLPALVQSAKALGKLDWANAKWTVVRKGQCTRWARTDC